MHQMITLLQEKDLLIQLKAGNEKAFRELYEYYWEEALATASARLEDHDAAKDIVQEVFVNIWKLREKLNVSSGFASYLFGAIKLRVIGHFQSEKVKKRVLQKALEKMQENSIAVQDLSTYYEMEKLVSQTIDLFPETMRIAFLMRSDDRSIREIAAELGLAEQTVKNNISEGLKRLRIVLGGKYPEQSVKYLLVLASLAEDHLTNN